MPTALTATWGSAVPPCCERQFLKKILSTKSPKHEPPHALHQYVCKASQETLLWSSSIIIITHQWRARQKRGRGTRHDCRLNPMHLLLLPVSKATVQSFLALLALAMFSCRLCFFFCSRSLASIILASFHDNKALAMKRGVKARMTVVRKP